MTVCERIQGNFFSPADVTLAVLVPFGRLTYRGGKVDDWDFAIFKWSAEIYDPEEWMFPGSEYVDGTIEGAMKAGMEAYPS